MKTNDVITRTCNRRAFTLIELLVVVAIIAMLMAILLPSLSRAREQSKTVACLANLKGMGTVLSVYAQDYEDKVVPVQQPLPGGASSTMWFTTLIAGGYAPANQLTASGADQGSHSVFRCPSGTTSLYTSPVSQTDPAGAGYLWGGIQINGKWQNYGCWYGVSSVTNDMVSYPFTSIPSSTGDMTLHKLSQIPRPGKTAMIYDGVWIHQVIAARINARHTNQTTTNVLLADMHAENQPTSKMPQSWDPHTNGIGFGRLEPVSWRIDNAN